MDQQQSALDFNPDKMPDILPILPLYDVALFPKMVLPLIVMQQDSIALVDEAMSKDRLIGFLVSKKTDMESGYTPDDLYSVGTSAMILKMAKAEEERAQLMVQGVCRYKVLEFVNGKPYLQARIEVLEEISQEKKTKETEALMSNILTIYGKIIKLSPGLPQEIGAMAKTIEDPGTLADMIASTVNISITEKQEILEIQNIGKRLEKVNRMVNYQLEILEIGSKIQTQVKEDMDTKQREYYLRQQLKAIQEELGDKDDSSLEVEEYRAKIEQKKLPEEASKVAERELKRLARMHPSSSEYTVSSTYLDWLTSLPWHESTKDIHDIKKARKILDDDHFGLEKAKKRILEYLAVRKLKPDSKGPIICFSGPPGTGKTSLAQSIARALGRKYVRIALGGVRDEAEIRGHRRTYVGALPGRIIQGIRRAESNNPVFILDEIDKVGTSFQGDPSSALLEVLDPEQNFSFEDHYLDVPFDLSKVIFITTANVTHTIPSPLLDRMEVMSLPGYTEEEKTKIANRFLIPRQRREHGIKANQLSITLGAVKKIISAYTREAGLRNLERQIANICRGAASRIAEGEVENITVKMNNLAKFLGPAQFYSETSTRRLIPGVVMGLAWTPSGGELLYIEATSMKGNKGLMLTGQLGDVMRESVNTALSYIRSKNKEMGIDETFFEKHDIHVHVPAGAIPKDGPSAGVTMMTALTSLSTGKKVRPNLAMTGEITLRGQVLAVGGIKEKVLAAYRAGIKVIILPKWNQKDMEDIPKIIQKEIEFHFIDKMDEVLEIAFAVG